MFESSSYKRNSKYTSNDMCLKSMIFLRKNLLNKETFPYY